jgi:hypothetical protein
VSGSVNSRDTRRSCQRSAGLRAIVGSSASTKNGHQQPIARWHSLGVGSGDLQTAARRAGSARLGTNPTLSAIHVTWLLVHKTRRRRRGGSVQLSNRRAGHIFEQVAAHRRRWCPALPCGKLSIIRRVSSELRTIAQDDETVVSLGVDRAASQTARGAFVRPEANLGRVSGSRGPSDQIGQPCTTLAIRMWEVRERMHPHSWSESRRESLWRSWRCCARPPVLRSVRAT